MRTSPTSSAPSWSGTWTSSSFNSAKKPAAEVLEAVPSGSRYRDLFEEEWLAPELEEGCFAAAASIGVALLVVDVVVDDAVRGHRLGVWAVAETIATMLPTATEMAAMFPHPPRYL